MVVSSWKGSAFERDIAVRLSLWVTGGADKKQFCRADTQRMGAKPGQVGPDGWANVGDIAPVGDAGRAFRRVFGVECKHVQAIDYAAVLTAPKAEWITWWPKIYRSCQPHNLCPLLIIRQNNRPILVGQVVSAGLAKAGLSVLYADVDVPSMHLVRLDDFMAYSWEHWSERWELWRNLHLSWSAGTPKSSSATSSTTPATDGSSGLQTRSARLAPPQ